MTFPWLSFRLNMAMGFLAVVLYGALMLFVLSHNHATPTLWYGLQGLLWSLCASLFLLAGVHGPRTWGRWGYGYLLGVVGLLGAAVTGWQVHLDLTLPAVAPTCPSFMLWWHETSFTSAASLLSTLGEGGQCRSAVLLLAGLPLSMWTVVAFLVIGGWGTVSAWRAPYNYVWVPLTTLKFEDAPPHDQQRILP